jgi:hypothetical protein
LREKAALGDSPMFRFSYTVVTALTLAGMLVGLTGCDLATIADIVKAPAKEDDGYGWGPFKMGMSLEEVQTIIKAKTGKPGRLNRLPGAKWETIFFENKIIMIVDGVLVSVMVDDMKIPDELVDES